MLGRGDMDGYAVWSWNFLGLWVVVGKGVFGTSDFGRFRTSNTRPEVRSWLQADIQSPEIDVRFTPNNGHSEAHAGLP